MPALPRPDLPPGAHRDLVEALHDLHHRAGWPSLRTLAQAAGCSHTTVSTVFSSPRLPAWGNVEVLVEAMNGDTQRVPRPLAGGRTPGTDAPARPPTSPAVAQSSPPYDATSSPVLACWSSAGRRGSARAAS